LFHFVVVLIVVAWAHGRSSSVKIYHTRRHTHREHGSNGIGRAPPSPLRFQLGKFVPQVSDKIEMRITCQAAEAKAYAEFLKAQAAEEAAAKDKTKR